MGQYCAWTRYHKFGEQFFPKADPEVGTPIFSANRFEDSSTPIRKDRDSLSHGGVFIVQKKFLLLSKPESEGAMDKQSLPL